jgi:hypothetical protein
LLRAGDNIEALRKTRRGVPAAAGAVNAKKTAFWVNLKV